MLYILFFSCVETKTHSDNNKHNNKIVISSLHCLIKNLDVMSLYFSSKQEPCECGCKCPFLRNYRQMFVHHYLFDMLEFCVNLHLKNINSPSPRMSVSSNFRKNRNHIHKTQNTTYYYFYLPWSFCRWIRKLTAVAMIVTINKFLWISHRK